VGGERQTGRHTPTAPWVGDGCIRCQSAPLTSFFFILGNVSFEATHVFAKFEVLVSSTLRASGFLDSPEQQPAIMPVGEP